MATTRVFFDMTADGAPVGKIIMEVSQIVIPCDLDRVGCVVQLSRVSVTGRLDASHHELNISDQTSPQSLE